MFGGNDYGYETFFNPEIKQAEQITGLNLNLKGMKGVKDLNKFDQERIKRKKQ